MQMDEEDDVFSLLITTVLNYYMKPFILFNFIIIIIICNDLHFSRWTKKQ